MSVSRPSAVLLAAAFLAALLVPSGEALARRLRVVPGDPIASVELPDDWSTSAIKRGTEVKSADEEVFLWFETYAPAAYDAVVAEHAAYFKGQGVAFTGAPVTSETAAAGASIKVTQLPATWKGAPTILRYITIDLALPSQKRILISYWASPEGDRRHDAAMKRVFDSLAPP